MALKRPKGHPGTFVVLEHNSKVLKSNPLGDPHLRKLGFRIPFNAESGEAIAGRWRNWRRHDPINLVAKYRANPKSLRGITIDCGWRDQYHIRYGSRILSQRLAEAGIRHRYEEFDDDHSDIDYRSGRMAAASRRS